MFSISVKTCKARIETKDVIVVAEYGDRDHCDEVSNVAAVALRASCKRAAKDISQRPSKIIRTALQSAVVTSDPWYARRLLRQELGYFEVVGVVFRTVVVAFG